MSVTILDYYKYAALATASYVRIGNRVSATDGTVSGRIFADTARDQIRLPLVLGEKLFVRTEGNPDVWNILHYYGGDMPGVVDNTGFAATLFKKDGENVLAIRGVEPNVTVTDAVRDLVGASVGGIGLLGVALNQLVDLVNLVQRLYGTGMVAQLRAEFGMTPADAPGAIVLPLKGVSVPSPIPGLPDIETTAYLSLSNYEIQGLGVLAAGDKITLTGHSLGGHLASAAAQLLGDRINPDVYVYNSPGFDPVSVDAVAAGARLFRFLGPVVTGLILGAKAALAESLGAGALLLSGDSQQASGRILGAMRSVLGTPAAAFTVHALESEDSAPGNDQSVVASIFTGASSPGAEQLVGTEQNSHAIEQMMDALALQAVLYRLDDSLNLPQLKKFIDAAHHLPGKSEEVLVEALHALLVPGSRFADHGLALPISDAAAGLDVWVGKGDIEARNSFHTALLEINQRLDALDLSATRIASITEEAGQPLIPEQLAQRATVNPDVYAYRYALKHLLPFAVIGVDYQTRHNTKGELDLYNPATKQGGLTKDWIRDRARLLQAVVTSNTQDNPDIARLPGSGNIRTQYQFYAGGPERVLFADPVDRPASTQAVMFADDASRALIGFGFALGDRLYGGRGTDFLEGRKGDDRLEGGKGLDVYNYNAFSGLLSSGNDGADTILDTDGKGVLRYTFTQSGLLSRTAQSTVISDASMRVSGLAWNSADGKFTYLRSQNDLVITINGDAGGSITLKDFRDGDFGIRLWEARATPQTAAKILGDLKPEDFDPATPGTQTQTDALGNVIVTDEIEPDRDDVIYGNRPDGSALPDPNASGEKIEAGGGHDVIFSDRPRGEADNGLGDADWILAGAGRDIIEAGAGNDLIEAGPDGVLDGQAGGDIADGGAGNDDLYAESRSGLAEALRAGNEAAPTNVKGDLLSGAGGDDWILGDRANDLLLGGSGQDLILGGAGDDTIWGDGDLIAYTRGWQVERIVTLEAGRKTYTARVAGATVTESTAGAADVIYGGAGSDRVFAGTGDDFIDAGAGDDVSFGEAGSDILIGGAGNDVLVGDNPDVVTAAEEGGDYLDGGEGDDELSGNGGDDILIGGPGNDLLNGGPGKDIYVFNKGDGKDTVVDTLFGIDHPEAGILVLGEGFSRGGIKFHLGSLLVDLGPLDPSDPNSPRDEIRFEGFDQFHPLTTPVLGEIRFADGESMTYEEILAQGFDIEGTEGDDDGHDAGHPMLVGTAVTDRIRGFGGNDIMLGGAGGDVLDGGAGDDHLQGGEGNDVLIGGPGADVLQGEAGEDTYFADFEDIINDSSGGDLIDLGLASPQEVAVSRAFIDGRAAVILSRAAEADRTRVPEGLTLFGDIATQNVRFAFGGEEFSSEAFFNLAFTDSLQLFGTADDDVLRGFGGADHLLGLEGDDLLIGGAGDDTLEGGSEADTLEGGAGADTLIGGAGPDVYLFSPGAGRDTIIDAGEEVSVDALQFAAEVAPEQVTFARQANGDLKVILNDADQITVSGQYSDSLNRIEEFRFADGRIITAGELDALAVPPITGGAGDDVLTGGPFDDVLLGLAGADTLDGKGGNDTLVGGEGVDTYVLDYAMGRDAVTDSGENVIALRSGLRSEDLSASRRGEDLLVSIRGTAEGLTLKDYYLAPQQWRVRDGSAVETPIEDVIAATDARAQQGAAAVRDDYVAGLRADFAREFSAQGYVALGNDAFARTTTVPYDASYVTGTQDRTTIFRDVNGEITSTQRETFPLGHWTYTGGGTLFRNSAQLQSQTISSNAAFIAGGGGTRFQTTATSFEWKGITWTVTAKGPVNRSSQSSIQPLFGPVDPATGERPFLGTVETRDAFVFQQNFARGDLGPVPPGVPPAIPPASHLFPRVAFTRVVEENITQRFVEMLGGAGDNTITGGDIVQAGAGNDTVDSTGFIDGGAGNDTLTNGSLIIGGAGDDQLTGTFGPNRFWLSADANGTDTIRDEEGIGVVAFAGLYYRSIGAPEEALALIAGGDERGSSLEAVIQQFGLPELPRPDDLAAIEPVLVANDVPMDTVEFGPGVSFSDLSFAWNVDQAALELSWAGGAAQIAFPLSNSPYGFGIERFSFADGTELGMSELLAAAPPKPVLPILGTPEADFIEGSRFGDVIRGLDGDDAINAGGGNDVIEGGDGNDALEGGAGDDIYLFGAGAGNDFIVDFDMTPGNVDTVRFGAGIDPQGVTATFDGFGSFVLQFDGSSDSLVLDQAAIQPAAVIERFEFADGTVWDRATIEALAGSTVGTDTSDVLAGTGGDDRILGLGGDDAILAADGNDYIEGGPGNDALTGGLGDDIYVFNPGDGVDTIADAGGYDKIIFGPGITPEMLSLGLGSLLIRVGDQGDAIHLADFDPADALSARGIEDFLFADGSFLSYGELVARGFDLFGTASDDFITGTNVTDRIRGGAGNDVLEGGQGSDRYLYALGDGSDTIIERLDDPGSTNALVLEGIGPGEVTVARRDENFILSVPGAGEITIVSGAMPGVLEAVEFSDGTVWDAVTLESMATTGQNTAPILASTIADQTAQEDAVFSFTLPAGTFADADAGDTLGFTAARSDGTSLPAWLSFDAATQSFSGAPTNDDVGAVDIAVTATDQEGLTASDTFRLTVVNTNDAPLLVTGIGDKSALEDAPFSFTIPAGTFADEDLGDVLTFDAAAASIGVLPAWLVFDAATQTFSGAPSNDDVGTLALQVTATDQAGASATGTFNFVVQNVNDTPELVTPLADQLGNQNAVFRFTVPETTFADVDAGDALSFAAALADGSLLPAWLAFDPLTRTLGGTPTEFDVGAHEIRVSATDAEGLVASDTFALWISDAATSFVTHRGTKRADVIRRGFDNDLIEARKGDDTVYSGAGRDLVLGGKGDDHIHAGYGNDYLFGGKGDDRLFGEAGNDVLVGEAGEDRLDGGSGNDLLDGGAGKDHLIAGGGSNLLIGGPGGDKLAGGDGHDVFLFNRGDGKATLHLGDAAVPGNTDTLSLGKDIAPEDIILQRSGRDLLVKVDESDEDDDLGSLKIVLKDWYAAGADHRTITRLQLIGSRIETYDFTALVGRFDAATRGRGRHWHAGPAMSEALLSTSDSEAIGGALAHQHATRGTLTHVSAPAIQATLADPLLGDAPQPIADAGGQLLEPYFAAEGEEGTEPDNFVALVSDPGVVNGVPLVRPASSEEVAAPPYPGRRGGRQGKDSNEEERWEALIESWFDRARDKAIPLSALLNGDDAGRGEHRRGGHSPHHPTHDEIAASWRRTQALLEAHLASPDPAALGGGEERMFSTLFSGLGGLPPALSGDRLPRVSGHHLRRLEGLEEGLSKLGS